MAIIAITQRSCDIILRIYDTTFANDYRHIVSKPFIYVFKRKIRILKFCIFKNLRKLLKIIPPEAFL